MRAGWLAMSLVGCFLILAGCSSAKIKTHPVQGKVTIQDGDVAILTGSHVELLAPDGAAEKRASGVIAADGTFVLKTLYEGEVVAGAPEGEYKARIILGDPSDENVPKRSGNPVHQRYLQFETSGLAMKVPSGEYSLSLSKK